MKRYTSRPFPPYRHEPGKTPHPERHPDGHMYGRETEARADDFLYGIDLFNAGYYWEAHVFWEGLWVDAIGDQRTLLQALIQISAALVKKRQGSIAGRDKLFEKALSKLRRLPGPVLEGVEIPELVEAIESGASFEIELRL